MSQSRRTVLGTAVAALGSVAGCSTLNGGSDNTATQQENPTDSADTPTETPSNSDDNSELEQRVEELETKLNDTQAELEATTAELETAQEAATEAIRELVSDKYVYALSLSSAADDHFEQAVDEWESQEFGAVVETANRAIGLYLAGQEAAKEAAAQANEYPTRWSGDPSSAATRLLEYGREMEAATETFIEAAKTAEKEQFGQAEAIREDVSEAVSEADNIETLSTDEFEAEL